MGSAAPSRSYTVLKAPVVKGSTTYTPTLYFDISYKKYKAILKEVELIEDTLNEYCPETSKVLTDFLNKLSVVYKDA